MILLKDRSFTSRKSPGLLSVFMEAMNRRLDFMKSFWPILRTKDLRPKSFALEMTLIDYGLTHDQSQFITEIQIPLNPDCPGIIA